MNYAEFAFGYNATLNGTILLENAFKVEPAVPESGGGIADDTFTVVATACGPDGVIQGGALTQGDYVHICINSISYPEASISGIDSLTNTAPFGSGSVVLDAIVGGSSEDLLTKVVAATDCADGSQCIVMMQLKGTSSILPTAI